MAYPNAEVMIHELQSGIDGSGSEIKKQADRLVRMGDHLFEMVARHTGQTVSKIKDDCVEEMYMSATEAMKYGIIDKIVKPSKKLTPLIVSTSLIRSPFRFFAFLF